MADIAKTWLPEGINHGIEVDDVVSFRRHGRERRRFGVVGEVVPSEFAGGPDSFWVRCGDKWVFVPGALITRQGAPPGRRCSGCCQDRR